MTAKNETGGPSELRSEDMFLAWFLRLPPTADVAREARIAIARIDASRDACDATKRLRGLLVQAIAGPFVAPRSRSRH